jgi:vancomycin resistance protein VanW
MKFKRIRLAIQRLKMFLNGWSGRLCRSKASDFEIMPWHVLVDYNMRIRWREELGDLNKNRIANMKICCELLNNLVVEPGQIFSLQHIIGEPSGERGFSPGPTIIDGRLDTDSGGGICQISTALFNAALLSNLSILEKHNHSSDVWGEQRIVDLGLDATYSFGRLDLKFENTLCYSVAIKMAVDENQSRLNCSIVSLMNRVPHIEIKSEVIQVLLPKILRNEQTDFANPRKGWIVRTRRFTMEDNSRLQTTYDKTEKYLPITLPMNTGNEVV